MPLYGEQVVKLHIGEGFQDLGPRAAREPVAVTPQADGPWLIPSGLGYGSVAAFGVDEAGSVFEHVLDITISKSRLQPQTLPLGTFPTVTSWTMSATDWTQLEEPHERLKWARKHAQFTTASAAAESLGMKAITYSAYEREPGSSKNIPLDHQLAIQAGRKYRVSWTWLLVGEGTPFDKPSNPHQQRAIQAMATVPEEKQAALAEAIEALVRSAA